MESRSDSKLGVAQPQGTLAADELAAVEKLQKGYHDLRSELGKVIVGQEAVIEELLIALFCRATRCSSACRAWRRRC